MTELTDRQRAMIRHALGLASAATPYRTHFVSYEQGDDFPNLVALEAAGFMRRGPATATGRPELGDQVRFDVTAAGAAAVGAQLPDES